MADALDTTAETEHELRLQIQELEAMLHSCRARLPNPPQDVMRELAESEERLALAARGTSDGIWDWDIKSNVVYFAPRFKQLLGYEDGEMDNLFSEFEIRLHLEDHAPTMAAIKAHLEQQLPYDVEYRLKCKDGAYRWFRARGSALHDGKGRPYRMAGSITDITEQKESNRALAQSQERFALAVRGTNDGIWDWDIRTNKVFFSPRWKNMVGYEDSELESTFAAFESLLHPEDHQRVLTALQEYLDGKSERYAVEFRFHHKDGTWRWILARGRALRDEEGNPYRMAGSHTDVTEQKQAEEQLRQARLAAEAANRAKSAFLANMSHEIRTPMNGIIGMSELLLKMKMGATQQEYLVMLKDSAESLLSLLNDVLDFSKIEAGKMEIDAQDFNLRDTIADTLQALGVRAMQKKLTLTHEVAEDVPQVLMGDDGRLRQIMINLVGNAIKFTDRGSIRVTARIESHEPEGTRLHFEIQDTGIGIAPEVQGRIFEAFTQAETTMTRRYGGTGLGLAICRDLVEMMNGRIWVESEIDQGSTFHFTTLFGTASGAELPPRANASPPLPPVVRLMNVLVVEDGRVNQLVASKFLEERGHSVKVVENGREAIEAVRCEKFDAILMDVHMPEMNGYQATATIRQIEARIGGHVPIIAMTANALKGDREQCLRSGMDGYVSKPVHAVELLRAVERYADGRAVAKPRTDTDSDKRPKKRVFPAFNIEEFRASAGDAALAGELIKIYPEDSGKFLLAATQALAAGDAEALYEAAHSLKGMLGVYAADRAVEAASHLCHVAQSRDLFGARGILETLRKECHRLGTALAAMKL